jgi:hypothetical protein
MPFATADDVLDRWAGSEPPSHQLAGTYTADAEVLIRAEFPDIDDRIDEDEAGGVSAERVRLVVVGMVTRALWNPDRKTAEGVTDYSVSIDVGSHSRLLQLTADDRIVLAGRASSSAPSAFTISMGPTEPPAGWIGGVWAGSEPGWPCR